MVAKALLTIFSTVLLQTISAQCIGPLSYGLPYSTSELSGLGCGCGLPLIPASSGGGFIVTTSSPIAPLGISVVSENAIDGIINVAGQLPLLSVVGLEGSLSTAGNAGVGYSCGNGQVGIINELAAPGLGYNALAYGLGLTNRLVGLNGARECGCGV